MALLDSTPADGAPYAAAGVTTVLSANQLSAIGVLSVEQAQGARVIVPFEADFTGANNTTIIDLTVHQASFKFTNPRTLFFDNSGNPSPVLVTIGQTTQEFPIPPNAAGYFPLAAQNNSRISLTSIGGASQVGQGQLYNYNVAPQVWYEAGIPVIIQPSSGTLATTVADGADVTQGAKTDAAVTNPATVASVVALLKGILTELIPNGTGNVTPRALTTSVVAVGGTAVVAIAGPLNSGFIYNPATIAGQNIAALESIWVDMVGVPGTVDGGTTIEIKPGQSFVLPNIGASTSVRVNAATTAHRFAGEVW